MPAMHRDKVVPAAPLCCSSPPEDAGERLIQVLLISVAVAGHILAHLKARENFLSMFNERWCACGSRLAASCRSSSSSSMPAPAKVEPTAGQPLPASQTAGQPLASSHLLLDVCALGLAQAQRLGGAPATMTEEARQAAGISTRPAAKSCSRHLANCRRQPSPPAAAPVSPSRQSLTGRAPASAAHSSGRIPAAAERG